MLVYRPKNSFNHTTQLWHKYKKDGNPKIAVW